MNQLITVNRDCDATLIPSGEKITLVEGTHVRITQALGGDYTLFVNGNLVKGFTEKSFISIPDPLTT